MKCHAASVWPSRRWTWWERDGRCGEKLEAILVTEAGGGGSGLRQRRRERGAGWGLRPISEAELAGFGPGV